MNLFGIIGILLLSFNIGDCETIEESGRCTVYPGYDISPGYDLKLYRWMDQATCCDTCYEIAGCVGWTVYQGKCHLKESVELVKARSPSDTVSGLKGTLTAEFSEKPPQVQSPRYMDGPSVTCDLKTDYAIVGKEIQDVGYKYLSECCHLCSQKAGCTGWTHTGYTCSLRAGTEFTSAPGQISGTINRGSNTSGDSPAVAPSTS